VQSHKENVERRL